MDENENNSTDADRGAIAPRDQPAALLLLMLMLLGLLIVSLLAATGWESSPIVDADTARRQRAVLRVDINTAAWPELASLPQIGPTVAKAIVDSRVKEGPFTDLRQLKRVHGLGDKTITRITEMIVPLRGEKDGETE